MATVHVLLVDAASGQPIGEVDLPPDQLPESFAKATTLHLGDSEWQVEHAEPVTREEAVAAGRLRLVLHRIQTIDPQKVLFSLPTLENALPSMQDGGGDVLRIHEDDWRQIELVAPRFEPKIDAEFAAIREVFAERVGPAYRRLHVRERIPEPLAGTALTINEVSRGARRALGIGDSPGIVAGGFAFDVKGGAVYGHEDAGHVVALGVWRAAPKVLRDIARAHRLFIVDWCAVKLIRP